MNNVSITLLVLSGIFLLPLLGACIFQIGFIILIAAAVGWVVLAAHEKPITADASTDTTEQIPLQVENLNQEELPK